uniref:Uncharacterized protein n=1 Tax=Labrus bergylta TaxID=56723 RepID=A0A3Q3EAS4_9LABR
GGSRMQRRGDESDESDDDEDDDDDEEDDEEEEEEEEDSEHEGKEHRHHHRRRRRRADDDEEDDSDGGDFDPDEDELDTLEDEEDEEEEEGRWDSDPEPPVLLVSDLTLNLFLMSLFFILCVYLRSCDKRLWSHVDVSRCSPLSNQSLAGIIKRQPSSLDLSWTPLAKRQLTCLLSRLPGLRELRVTGLSWSCLSALASPSLPCLRLLDLRWCEGIRDAQIKEIIIPPDSESTRSRLRNMGTLHLSGLEVSDSSLRLLQRHMPQLQRLDLSHCKDISDSSIALLTAAGTHTRHNLTELYLAGETTQVAHSAVFNLHSVKCPAGSDSSGLLIMNLVLSVTQQQIRHDQPDVMTDHQLLISLHTADCPCLSLPVSGCSELTDTCLSYLKRLSCLSLLDLRGCSGVSRRACDAFISDLSHVAHYCMMEEKLIQRMD